MDGEVIDTLIGLMFDGFEDDGFVEVFEDLGIRETSEPRVRRQFRGFRALRSAASPNPRGKLLIRT